MVIAVLELILCFSCNHIWLHMNMASNSHASDAPQASSTLTRTSNSTQGVCQALLSRMCPRTLITPQWRTFCLQSPSLHARARGCTVAVLSP